MAESKAEAGIRLKSEGFLLQRDSKSCAGHDVGRGGVFGYKGREPLNRRLDQFGHHILAPGALIIGLSQEHRLDHVTRLRAPDKVRENRHFSSYPGVEGLDEALLDTIQYRKRSGIMPQHFSQNGVAPAFD
jgi:hypothetical protein